MGYLRVVPGEDKTSLGNRAILKKCAKSDTEMQEVRPRNLYEITPLLTLPAAQT